MRTRIRLSLAGLVLAAALVGGVAWATIPDAAGVINGCYRTSLDDQKGQLRIVDDPAGCRNNELAIHWNQEGPQGDQGPQGPKGDKGDTGDTGAPGADGADGVDGEDGQPGADGTNGLDGAPGAPGDPCLPTNPACVGPKGDQGDTGPQGPAGTGGGNVYTKSTATIKEWTGPAPVTALSLSLPAGSFLVNARAEVTNLFTWSGPFGVDVIRCQLGSDVAGNVSKPIKQPLSDKLMLVSLVQLAAPGQLDLTCELNAGDPRDIWQVRMSAIVALQTGPVTTQ